ncbi:calcium-binding protein [Sphingomonas sp. DG1-23]|uniref:calcium-binding protein n=1 Tax=Sphingomonas sp. DG1-23 TaxID=3068316 RepID=UPI00273F8375|nr:calcium-binding protein [Sphingomonas sp. DG1-23]MDP5280669.1 calcium-binding protein [Sphingomonas sp. DG1-23]
MSDDYSYADVRAIIAALPNSQVDLPDYAGGIADTAYLKTYVTELLTDIYDVPASVFDHATVASTTLIRDFLNRALLFQDDRVARVTLDDLGLTISAAFDDVASLLRYPAAGSCGDHNFQLYQIFKAFGFDCAWIDSVDDITGAYLTSHATTLVMVEDLDKWIVQDSYENFLFRGQDGAFLSFEEARIAAASDRDNVVFDGLLSYLEYPELGYGRNITAENQIVVADDLFSIPRSTVYTLDGVQYVHSFTGGFSDLASPYDPGSDHGGVFVDPDAALAAVTDLSQQGLSWQAAANALRVDHYVSGFTLNPGDSDASQWLTVRLADGSYISINYGESSYLSGSLEQLVLLAGAGNLPAGFESFTNGFLGGSYTIDSTGYITADWVGAPLIQQNSRPGAEALLQFAETGGSVPLSSVVGMADDDGDTATFIYVEVMPWLGGAYLMSADGEMLVSGGRTLNASEIAEWRIVPAPGGSTASIQLRVSDGIAWSDPIVPEIGTIDSATDDGNQYDWETRRRFEYEGQRYGEAYSLDDGGARTIEYDVHQANAWSERWVESDDQGQTRYIKTVFDAGGGRSRVETNVDYTLTDADQAVDISALSPASTSNLHLTGNVRDNLLRGNAGSNTLDGGAGHDTLWGYGGDDIYIVREAEDVVVEVAGEGFDTVETALSYTLAAGVSIEVLRTIDANATTALNLTGNELDNRLEGNAGGNILDGAGGSNVLAGGDGDDFYIVRGANDLVVEVADQGFDTVTTTTSYALAADASIELLRTSNANATTALNLTGSALSNRLEGNAGANTLDGAGGDDVLVGGRGDDRYIVRTATDRVIEVAGEGFDTVFAGASYTLAAGVSVELLRTAGGSSTLAAIDLTGNEFDNVLAGNAAGNTLDGGAGNDTLWGYGGDDTYIVREAGDVVVEAAGEGFDTVRTTISYTLAAGVSIEVLRTLDANATTALNLTGNALDNRLEGNAGSNVLDGAGGNNVLAGGGGDDFYVVRGANDVVAEAAGEGFDTVTTTTSYVLAAGAEIELLRTADAAATTALNLTGNAFDNRLEGNAGANTLDGGGGANMLSGGQGDDTYIVRNSNDVVIERAGEGFDTIITTTSYALAAGASVELLRTVGSSNGAAIDLTGNERDNILAGNAAGNTLDGGAGNDTLWGYGGDDVYIIRSANDVVVEAAGEGFDTVKATTSYTLGAGVSVELLRTLDANATTTLGLTGNELDNRIEGNAGSNVLDGAGGSNVLAGAAGDDFYIVRGANDVVIEVGGEGFDTVASTTSYMLGAASSIELLRTSDANATTALNLTGNALDNRLEGNAGANILDGAGGDDVLVGGRGDDGYIVRTANDRVIEAAGEGFDTVFAGASYTLAAGVSVELLRTAGGSSTLAAIDLTGNELNNILAGNAAGNLLDGGAGNDTLWGYGGDDVYIVRSANDVVVETAGSGMDTVKATVSYVLGAGVSVELLRTLDAGATTALNLTGNEFDNRIEGNAGNNVLDGGGGGNVLTGYGGQDSFVLRLDAAADTIADFASGEDRLVLDLSSFGLHHTGTLVEAGIDFLELGASGQAAAALYYDAAAGKIFWDSDGAGAAGMVEIASLGADTLLTSHDFFVV